jgi:hypothetical protein
MNPNKVKAALVDISREKDPTVKSQKLASLCSTLFREQGYELVVVGGSAIEFYTDGQYTSGDLDLCLLPPKTSLSIRLRQEIMGQLGAKGGPRSWEVAGMFVDVLGPAEISGNAPLRRLEAPYGTVVLIDPEELLVERVLISVYPSPNREAAACARQLIAAALTGDPNLDWREVRRIAKSRDYDILAQCVTLVRTVADELKVKSPLDPTR